MISNIPLPARVLGFAGAIPFVALAAVIWLARLGDFAWAPSPAVAEYVLIAYGATILSFLGAVHWGAAMTGAAATDWPTLGWSVMPSLIGWAALLVQPQQGLLMLMIGLALAFAVDRRAILMGQLPRWYLPLRQALSALAVASLGAALLNRVAG
jgi:hypothetical protein